MLLVDNGLYPTAGLQVALGADFRFATPDAKLSIMEAKWGIIPDMSASVTLRELVRMDVAKELTMTGRVISGQEAAGLGLVTRCVNDPMKEATNLANEIIQRYVSESKPKSVWFVCVGKSYGPFVVLDPLVAASFSFSLLFICLPGYLFVLRIALATEYRSPDSVAKAKQLFQSTWFADEKDCLQIETNLQLDLLPSFNQAIASGRNMGLKVPYMNRRPDKKE